MELSKAEIERLIIVNRADMKDCKKRQERASTLEELAQADYRMQVCKDREKYLRKELYDKNSDIYVPMHEKDPARSSCLEPI